MTDTLPPDTATAYAVDVTHSAILPPPPTDAARIATDPDRHPFTVLVGPMRSPREQHERIVDPPLIDLLRRPYPTDTILTCLGDPSSGTILDLDTHHWPTKPSDAMIEATVLAMTPAPQAWWVSHGKGAKLFYVGQDHRSRALAAALAVPASMKVEFLPHTRHPGSASTAHPGAVCGTVHAGPTWTGRFRWQACGRIPPGTRDAWLAERGWQVGQRLGHDACPIGPHLSDTPDCVVVLEHGIMCHRCQGHGDTHPQGGGPGFVPYTILCGAADPDLDRLTRHFVHWAHARHELTTLHPNLTLPILRQLYQEALLARHGADDPRVMQVFNQDLRVVWTRDGWADATSLAPIDLDADMADSLPHCQRWQPGDEQVRIAKARRSNAKRRPEGYTPLYPHRAPLLREPHQMIPVLRPGAPIRPIALLDGALDEDAAWSQVERSFPGIDRIYLLSLLCACICAECSNGFPPMLCVSGVSGAGKNETITLASSIRGWGFTRLDASPDAEKTKRTAAAAAQSGERILVYDEFGKTPHLTSCLSGVLQLGRQIDSRRLYQDGATTIECRSPFVFTSVSYPSSLLASAEFGRRVYHIHLHRKVDWQKSGHGDTAAWRDRTTTNSHAANALLTIAYRRCAQRGFVFEEVAPELGLERLRDTNSSYQPDVMRQLYRYLRNEEGDRVLISNVACMEAGWADGQAGRLRALIEMLVPPDDQQARWWREQVKRQLEGLPWNDVLGIEMPLKCDVRVHGARMGVRFMEVRPALKGRHRVNEDLPAASSAPVASIPNRGASFGAPTPSPCDPTEASAAGTSGPPTGNPPSVTYVAIPPTPPPGRSVADVLAEGGLPS